MKTIYTFISHLIKRNFTGRPVHPPTREVCDAIKRKNETIYGLYDIIRYNLINR